MTITNKAGNFPALLFLENHLKRSKKQIPPSVDRSYLPFEIKTPGRWLVMGDVHLPYHDVDAVNAAVEYAVKNKVSGVLLNGDILDSHELSTFDKDPTVPRYVNECETAIQFLEYLRDRLPSAKIVYKEGNHEDRLIRYILRRAPALFGFEALSVPALLRLDKFKIDWVGDKRVIRLGILNVIHGHEYRPTVMTPVNPARGVFLRAKSVVLTSHFHQTSEHHEPTISGKNQAAWSIGCLCQLAPQYMPLNRWNHGFAIVEVAQNGGFSVRNLRVFNNSVV